jgi:hypothetical protein
MQENVTSTMVEGKCNFNRWFMWTLVKNGNPDLLA